MSDIIKKNLKIDGMTCINCEKKIESRLQQFKEIISVKVDYSTATANVEFDRDLIKAEQIEDIIENLGYKTKTAQDENNARFIGIIMILFSLYFLINRFADSGILSSFPLAQEGMGYGMLFVIGLLTSIHCIAMCGGINLSQCTIQKSANKIPDTKYSAIRPSFLYNLGRLISYTLIGALVGALGSVISFSGFAKGIVQLTAGIFMIIMGLNMLNLFPWLRKFNLRMPKIFSGKINKLNKNNRPFYVGLLNGLMPCGPLQAMQLYALSTGDPIKGALSMFFFSLGTIPLMFGLGALSSLITKKFSDKVMKVSAALVIVLGVYMFNNGINLSGFILNIDNRQGSSIIATVEDDFQTVNTQLYSGRYQSITVQKGIRVRWIISAESKDINGCNNEIYIPKYNMEKRLYAGDNIIEFTPIESGTFVYSCWMCMIKSTIIVIDDINNIEGTKTG